MAREERERILRSTRVGGGVVGIEGEDGARGWKGKKEAKWPRTNSKNKSPASTLDRSTLATEGCTPGPLECSRVTININASRRVLLFCTSWPVDS